jgi:hypothetical protein
MPLDIKEHERARERYLLTLLEKTEADEKAGSPGLNRGRESLSSMTPVPCSAPVATPREMTRSANCWPPGRSLDRRTGPRGSTEPRARRSWKRFAAACSADSPTAASYGANGSSRLWV